MARRSSVDALPDDVRRWLDRALSDQGFSQYQALEEALRERGFAISKSAIHRYGQKLERRLAAIKASTEAAKLMADASPDDQDARSEALTAMIQTELFETLVNLQEATDDKIDPAERVKMLSSAAKNIATLTRSSVNLKRFQRDVAAQVTKEAAETAASAAREGGATDDQVAFIRARILGIDRGIDRGIDQDGRHD
ncbi:DUF3486 family protein [Insolitispirillum peregrinum]|uniref:DUF3486 family protein n=1 Tax=Insolitispirillum peregrinum TaxID=80876 RepID=UPI00361A3D34